MSSSNHGGRRAGSGRKRGESSTVVRVPDGVLSEVRLLISKYKDSKLEISNSNQVNLPNVDMGCPVDPKFKPRNPHPKNLEKRQRRKKNKK